MTERNVTDIPELTPEELKRQKAEKLPDREMLSTIGPDPAIPVGPDEPLLPVDPVPKDVTKP